MAGTMCSNTTGNESEFKTRNVKVAMKLKLEEVESLAWLTEIDYSSLKSLRESNDAQSQARRLLKILKEACKITPDDSVLLKHALEIIGRGDLAKLISAANAAANSGETVCKFREALYRVSLNLEETEVASIRDLVKAKPITRSTQNTSALALFDELMKSHANDKSNVAKELMKHMETVGKNDQAEELKKYCSEPKV